MVTIVTLVVNDKVVGNEIKYFCSRSPFAFYLDFTLLALAGYGVLLHTRVTRLSIRIHEILAICVRDETIVIVSIRNDLMPMRSVEPLFAHL